jgi:uncharacterized coiled-coil protein SlyX
MNISKAPKEAFQFVAPMQIGAAAGEGARRFKGIAYSGQPITDHPYWGQVVFDLRTVKSDAIIPVLRQHDPEKIVGHTEAVSIGSDIQVDGVLDPTEFSAEVAALSDSGFPWQMSVNIRPDSTEDIQAGARLTVNGHEITGPATIFHNSRIREVSFVPLGADANTSAIALSQFSEGRDMAREQELEQRVTELNAQLATQAEQITSLTQANSALTEKFAATTRDRRVADVMELFTAIGVEFSDDTAKPYLALEDTAFAAVAKHMTDLKAKAGEHLFGEHAPGRSGDSGKSALVLDAERRAKLATVK